MKSISKIVTIVFVFFINCLNANHSNHFYQVLIANEASQFSQEGFKLPNNLDPLLLSRAYGYLKGQQLTLDRIKKEFPKLQLDVTKCELEFGLTFNKASVNIYNELKKLLGVKFEQFESDMIDKVKSIAYQQTITEELSINFIEEIKQRSKGVIESPILETLLTYQFIDNPAKEFSSGFTYLYSTKGHLKAKGATINVKLPLSWSKKEGDRPNVIQKIVSENGKGQEVILFMVKDLGLPSDYKITNNEINEFFSESEMKQMIPDGGEFISAKKITLDNHVYSRSIDPLVGAKLTPF